MTNYELSNRFEAEELLMVQKWNAEQPITAVYFDGERKTTYVKRFLIETSTLNSRFEYLPNNHRSTKLLWAGTQSTPKIAFEQREGRSYTANEAQLAEIADVTGWKALGSKLHDDKIRNVKEIGPKENEENQKALF